MFRSILGISACGLGLTGPTGGVVLENPDDVDDGITVTSQGRGVAIRKVTVQGFEENGVLLIGVDGFTLSSVTATDNGEYGLFPVLHRSQSGRGVRAGESRCRQRRLLSHPRPSSGGPVLGRQRHGQLLAGQHRGLELPDPDHAERRGVVRTPAMRVRPRGGLPETAGRVP